MGFLSHFRSFDVPSRMLMINQSAAVFPFEMDTVVALSGVG